MPLVLCLSVDFQGVVFVLLRVCGTIKRRLCPGFSLGMGRKWSEDTIKGATKKEFTLMLRLDSSGGVLLLFSLEERLVFGFLIY